MTLAFPNPDATFSQQLADYRQFIEVDLLKYAAHARAVAAEQYSPYGAVIMNAFFDMLERGSKRLRGTLVTVGYQMCGGTDANVIARAATAIEMVHASLLILDDVQDRSDLRRGQPTVHRQLEAYCKGHFNGAHAEDLAAHTGVSLALNAQLAGYNAAQMLIGGLNVDAELRAKAMGIVSHAVLVTAHGQTLDIIHENVDDASVPREEIDKTMEWKTAYYSVLNPLCVGMVLAGAGCEDTDAIRDYALDTGKAFQITDDLLGVFGDNAQTGKSVMDDIREGKQTALTAYALAHATPADRERVRHCLGKADLTPTEFAVCQQILEKSGAKAYTEDLAATYIAKAKGSLDRAPAHWRPDRVRFLRDLAESLLGRIK